MITKILSRARLKQLWLELLLNKTDKVSDISDNSVTNAMAYGAAVVGQKCLKDIAVLESQILPDSAVGEDLDRAASLFGVPARRGATQSSTYLRVIAAAGTIYDAALVTFVNYNGIRFIPESSVTIGSLGYDYIKVRSETVGEKTNVEPNSVVNITNAPVGHVAVTNEFMAIGGSDAETDEMLRQRIKRHDNLLARYTLDYYAIIFQMFNDKVLRVLNMGNDNDGKRTLAIVTQNGIDLTTSELDELLEKSKKYFSLRDLNRFGDVIGVKLISAGWYIVGDPAGDGSGTGIDFRVQLWEGYSADAVRKQIQINISKYLDFRYWEYGKRVEWDDLLQLVKDTEGVRYVPDGFFNPSRDEIPPSNKLPRVKKFIMRDLSNNIIADANNVLSPIFYPSNA